MSPKKVKKVSASQLTIEWDDEHTASYTLGNLRRNCPCAGCKSEIETRDGNLMLPIIMPGQFELTGLEPVGNYALQFLWKDGHKTGIYIFDFLRSLCECEQCALTTRL